MGQGVEYSNDKGTKQQENSNHVHYEACDKKQKYTKDDRCKQTEEKCRTKYVAGGGGRTAHHGGSRTSHSGGSGRHSDSRHSKSRSISSAAGARKSSKAQSGHCSRKSAPAGQVCSPKAKSTQSSLAQRMSRCYEIRRVDHREECNRKPCWQHGEYVRDECGSGIRPLRFDLEPSRRVWCKTPLSMYQATIGELARKLLCREVQVPRDVNGEPPSNIAEYILPPCRGYYRKYDCIRPCEEQYAVVRAGKKIYRDRVERYWEPCISKGQKHKLNINDYAPQNAYLSLKLRRRHIADEVQCW